MWLEVMAPDRLAVKTEPSFYLWNIEKLPSLRFRQASSKQGPQLRVQRQNNFTYKEKTPPHTHTYVHVHVLATHLSERSEQRALSTAVWATHENIGARPHLQRRQKAL